jgi:fucose permease
MRAILAKPTIYALGVAIFLHGVSQVGMVSWTGQLYQKKLSIDAARAAYFISVNSMGFFGGRLLLSWITARWKIPELLVLTACAAGGTLAFAGTIAAHDYGIGLALFAIAGFFISGDAPSINSYAGARFAGQSATAFSLMNGIGNIGGGAGPYLTGAIGNRFGLTAGIRLMPVFSMSLAAMALAWHLRQSAGRLAWRRGHRNVVICPYLCLILAIYA